MTISAYCDYNAGAPLRPEARAAMLAALEGRGNPSSVHADGRKARAAVEGAREAIAKGLGARAADVVFASGATEAAHLALEGAWAGGVRQLAVSEVEHECVFASARALDRDCAVLPVDARGVIDLAGLSRFAEAQKQPFLLALMLANNETGVIQPVAEASAIVHAAGGVLLCDACQGVGRIPATLENLGADYLLVSSHKLGGAPGAGVLAMACGVPFAPPRLGGGQERGRRPGTENIAAIAAMAAGLAASLAEREAEASRLEALRDAAEAALRAMRPDAVIFGEGSQRLANTSCFAVPGLRAETALIQLDMAGVRASSGAACSSGKVRASRALLAMGVAPTRASEALRISFGWASTEQDLELFLAAMATISAGAPKNSRIQHGIASGLTRSSTDLVGDDAMGAN